MASTGVAPKSHMKKVASERMLLSHAPPPKPAPPSRFSMLQTRCADILASAKIKATEVTDFVSKKAEAAKVHATERLRSTRHAVDDMVEATKKRAAKVAEPVLQRAALAAETVRAAQVSALSYVASTKRAATASYDRLCKQGVKAWSAETIKYASAMTKDAVTHVQATVATGAAETLDRTKQVVKASANTAVERANITAKAAQVKTVKLKNKAVEVAKDGKFQATAAGAVGGATTLGASGGVAGLATGSVVGAAVGLVPALFTFGLSIPIGAAIGGGTGLVVGTTVGGAAGAVGGGAAGYGIHANRHEIQAGAEKTLAKVSSGAELAREGAGKTLAQVSSGADFLKNKAFASACYMQDRTSEARNRLIRAA
eukprot:TRINITY_DN234_c0_g2_i1.p1 TRINITY_DN234_c0_g2~~TRINITY_DN234_c0_g2_i1.p1  ORF type:complete len:371 (+),score=127.99 TRINITY_DN234_c0_g2_i1:78-1190(+)